MGGARFADSGELVAERFTTSSWHENEHILAGHGGIYGFELVCMEGLEFEGGCQYMGDFFIVGHTNLVCGGLDGGRAGGCGCYGF